MSASFASAQASGRNREMDMQFWLEKAERQMTALA
jgi:hypothetical protein